MPFSVRPLRFSPWLAILRPAVKRTPILSPPYPQDSVAWLDGLIAAATAVREAADLTAFPYARVAASLVVQVLQIIQSVRKNKEDFEELARSLVQTIVMIRDTLRSCHQDYRPPLAFVARCQELIESLLLISSHLNDFARRSQSWTRYLKASLIQGTIAQYRTKFDSMRADFTLTTMMHLSAKVLSERPRELGYTWEHDEPVHLIDAMNSTLDLPMDLCSTPKDFTELLKFLFRNHRGRRLVEEGQYTLTVENVNVAAMHTERPQRIGPKLEIWHVHVQPGSTITMDILLCRDAKMACCPTCRYGCGGYKRLWGHQVNCPSCGTIFRMTGSEDSEIYEAFKTEQQLKIDAFPSNNLNSTFLDNHFTAENMDIECFRRFHVLLESSLENFVPWSTTMSLWGSFPSNEFDSDFMDGTAFEQDCAQWLDPYNLLIPPL